MIVIRPMGPQDRSAALELADRLVAGVAPWRTPDAVLRAVRSWVSDDIERVGEDLMVYVAVEGGTDVVGFLSIGENTHWSGQIDAYIGELVVRPDHEKQGVGTRLVRQAELWAADRGLRRIRLSTGVANADALHLYDALGYQQEDVTLSKRVPGASD